jgi:hypothetical protein
VAFIDKKDNCIIKIGKEAKTGFLFYVIDFFILPILK